MANENKSVSGEIIPSESEDKVVFTEGGRIRALRGVVIESEDGEFLVIHRRDGDWSIKKSAILKIEPTRRRL